MSNRYSQWEKLTLLEKIYIASHPQHALSIENSKTKAYSETIKRFGLNGRNDESDAFRHCYWSAILAREIGFENALQFTTAHESGEGNPRDEKTMDLHNNFVGLNIGKQFFHIAPGVGEYFETDRELADRCYRALKEGRLTQSPIQGNLSNRYSF